MKTTMLLVIAALSSPALHAQDSGQMRFSLDGKIRDLGGPAKVILIYSADGKRKTDTTALENGAFHFTGTINKPHQAIISVLKPSSNTRMNFGIGYAGEIIGRDGVAFYLDEGNITMRGETIKEAAISGSAAQKDFEALNEAKRPVIDKVITVSEEMKQAERGSETYQLLLDKLRATMRENNPVVEDFIASHPNSWVSWNALTGRSIISDPEAIQEQYKKMSPKFRNSEEGKKFEKRLDAAFKTAIGAIAPNFSQENTEGKPVSLASLRGKYVLIDFWASWCGPCRAENPNVRLAYEKYKDKNFEILAVSLDKEKDAWLKAIADDGLPWLHVSDLKGWENEVAQMYYVRAVPQNWLIDPNGKIIASNLRGKELEKRLSDVLQ